MTKDECTKMAEAARAALAKSHESHALMIVLFGASSDEAARASAETDRHVLAIATWERMARAHHATRAAALRKRSLPADVFGYGVAK